MKKMIAVTGGIGSGKSTVMKILASKGYPVFSCDEIYEEVIVSEAYISKLKELFPLCVTNGQVDRKRLAKEVFSDREKRERLNRLAHPLIMKRLFEKMQREDSFLVFAEVPLLFEGNFEKDFDAIIVVQRAVEQRVAALQKRDNASREDVLRRIRAQFPYDSPEGQMRIKNSRAYILSNEGSLKALQEKISEILMKIHRRETLSVKQIILSL